MPCSLVTRISVPLFGLIYCPLRSAHPSATLNQRLDETCLSGKNLILCVWAKSACSQRYINLEAPLTFPRASRVRWNCCSCHPFLLPPPLSAFSFYTFFEMAPLTRYESSESEKGDVEKAGTPRATSSLRTTVIPRSSVLPSALAQPRTQAHSHTFRRIRNPTEAIRTHTFHRCFASWALAHRPFRQSPRRVQDALDSAVSGRSCIRNKGQKEQQISCQRAQRSRLASNQRQ